MRKFPFSRLKFLVQSRKYQGLESQSFDTSSSKNSSFEGHKTLPYTSRINQNFPNNYMERDKASNSSYGTQWITMDPTLTPEEHQVAQNEENLTYTSSLNKYLESYRNSRNPLDIKMKKAKEVIQTHTDSLKAKDNTIKNPHTSCQKISSNTKTIKPGKLGDESSEKLNFDSILTGVKLTSKNIKFGDQNLRGTFLTHKEINPIDLESEYLDSSRIMAKDDKSKGDKLEKKGDDTKPKKTRKKICNKSKGGRCRRRRRIRWFSKIPIEPNMKGSVIFANGSAQEMEDPCKILSVNFSASTLIPMDNHGSVSEDIMGRHKNTFTAIRDNEDINIDSNLGYPFKFVNTLGSNPKITENLHLKDGRRKILQHSSEPIVRQKKISQLDKTVKVYKTTVFPQIPKPVKKRLKKVKKCSKSELKPSSTENLNNTSLDLRNYPKTSSLDAFTKDCSLSSFQNDQVYKEIKGKHFNFNSSDSKEKRRPLQDVGMQRSYLIKSGGKRNIISGLTRPVTEKAASMNILKSKTTSSISTTWKRNGLNLQQKRLKSTGKSGISWESECYGEEKPCTHPLPADWDHGNTAPENIDCKRKVRDCPITSEDLRYGPPYRKPASAAALNRCNLNDCRKRLSGRKSRIKCGDMESCCKPVGRGKCQ